MDKWIYERPGNQLITRRPIGISDMKELQIAREQWLSLDSLRKIGKKYLHEQQMRELHPDLMDLWKSYQCLLALLEDRKDVA